MDRWMGEVTLSACGWLCVYDRAVCRLIDSILVHKKKTSCSPVFVIVLIYLDASLIQRRWTAL